MVQGITVTEEFPPGFFDAFGRMVMWFGRIEYLMKLVHSRLGGEGMLQGFLDATNRDEFEKRCRDFQQLYDARFSDPMQRLALAKVLGSLRPLWEYRNDCIHCCWKPEAEGLVALRPKLVNGKLEWQIHRTTAARMDEVAQALVIVYAAFDQLSKISGLEMKAAAAA
jgi:hypothetical protein